LTALKALTIWPAWQHFEEDDKGSIEVGKVADFVVLSDDPTAVDPEALADLQVLVTVKEDEVIYAAEAGANELSHSPISNDPGISHTFMHVIYESMQIE